MATIIPKYTLNTVVNSYPLAIFPHTATIVINQNPDRSHEFRSELVTWLNTTFGNQCVDWNIWTDHTSLSIFFKNAQDLMLFKLRWAP